MPNEQQKLYTATNRLARYFGLYTARDLSGRIALEQLQGIVGANSTTANFDLPPPPQEITDLVAAIIDTSEGTYLLHDLVDRINNTMTGTTSAEGSDAGQLVMGGDGDLQQRINRFIEITGPEGATLNGAENPVSMNDVLGNNFINNNPNNPDKDISPHLSVIKVNNVRITPTGRNINAITVFLNGIPTIELAKAVPYLNIQLLTPGSPISQNGRLENISLFRFLEGNVQVDASSNDVRSTIALANKVRNASFLEGEEPTEQNTTYTSTGMEIFTSPQTLVNGNEYYNNPDRVNPILDKFQPLLTLKELSVDVAPSTGLMSFKTARLNFILHDRSRLAEIANLIRPDLYARTELMIEYGWNHPEANIESEGITNYYAELINAMRCREKYGIVNSSLTFQEGGLVDITLELAMRGGTDASSEAISTDETGNVNQVLSRIRELSETIGTEVKLPYTDQGAQVGMDSFNKAAAQKVQAAGGVASTVAGGVNQPIVRNALINHEVQANGQPSDGMGVDSAIQSPAATPPAGGTDTVPSNGTPSDKPKTLNAQGFTVEQLAQGYQNAMMAGDTKSATHLKSMYDMEVAYQKTQKSGAGSGLTTTAAGQLGELESSYKLADTLTGVVDTYKDKMGPFGGRVNAANPYDTNAQAFQSQMKLSAQVIGKALEGGVLRKEDELKYEKILPQIGDTPEVAKKKIENVKALLKQKYATMKTNFEGSSPDGLTPGMSVDQATQ
jgi:hypothetical protein